MFKRLAEAARAGRASRSTASAISARAGDTVAAALLAAGIDHCRTTPVTRRAARALLPDGRVLRLPGHDRRRRQPPGLPGAGARGHGDRDRSAASAEAGHDDATRPTSRRRTTSPSSAAGRPASRRRAGRARPALRPCCSTRIPASAARSIAASPRRRCSDRAILGEDYWAGAALARRGQGERRARSSTAPRCGASIATRSRSASRSRGSARMIAGAARHPRDRRAGAAVSDSRLDAARRDDGRRRRRPRSRRQGLRAGRPHGAGGRGPLLWLLAAQLLRAGGTIEAILDTTPRAQLAARAAASAGLPAVALLRQGPGAAARGAGQGAGHPRRQRRGRAARTSSREVVFGTGGARAAHRRPTCCCCTRAWCRTSISRIAAGVAHRWNDAPALLRARARRDFGDAPCPASPSRATAPASPAARRRPSAAASRPSPPCAALQARARRVPQTADASRQTLAREEMGRAFLDTLYQPAPSLPPARGRHDRLPLRGSDRAADPRHGRLGCEGPNQMKAFLRCGMGPCQGRLCGLTVTELIADAARRRRRPRSATTACARR